MTKGKYAEKAALRRAHLEVEGNLGTYQKRVAELTAENKALKTRAVEQQRAHSAEIKRLKAERNEGTSPTLRAVESECRRLRDQLAETERAFKRIKKQWNVAAFGMREHFIRMHGMGKADSLEALLRITGDHHFVEWDGEGHFTQLVEGWEKAGIPADEINRRIDAFAAINGTRQMNGQLVEREV